jgi:hypothetical protein
MAKRRTVARRVTKVAASGPELRLRQAEELLRQGYVKGPDGTCKSPEDQRKARADQIRRKQAAGKLPATPRSRKQR